MKLLISCFLMWVFLPYVSGQPGFQFQNYGSGIFSPGDNPPFRSDSVINPLTQTYWGQACYYNDSCPADAGGSCGHSRTGCGATAMAQMMRFHQFPVSGAGNISYSHPVYGEIVADFGNAVYNWQEMPPNLTVYSQPGEVASVARIMFHAGAAVEMDYGATASFSGTTSIRNALPERFGYSTRAQLLKKSHFADSVWVSLLLNELDHGRPVFYAISSGTGGHFVVLDGYAGSGCFHFNWGNGLQAGYNKLLSELPVVQEAIIGIEPDTVPSGDVNRFLARFCRFDDGSGMRNYENNSSAAYLIQPPLADSLALFFTLIDLEDNNDTLTIYDGPDENSPLLGTYTGGGLPGHLVSSSPEVLLTFTSGDTLTGKGWGVEYTTFVSGEVSGLVVLTDTAGAVEDGSVPSNYENHTDAYWLIKPPGATSVTASFSSFNTEFCCDYLWIYDGDNTAPENLLGKFSGTTLPPEIKACSGAMLLHFNTDFSTTRPGWELNYSSGYDEVFIDAKVILEGPFSGSAMTVSLNQQDYLPLQQPFSNPPWNYPGSESVPAIPSPDITDWVLIELRDAVDAPSASSGTILARQAAFLCKHGAIVATDGMSPLPFSNLAIQQSLFIVVMHRNHLPVISSGPAVKAGGVYRYDFSGAEGQAWGGQQAQRECAPGIWALIAADGNADGQVNNADKVEVWTVNAGSSGYLPGDFNLDGEAGNTDKNELWIPSTGYGSQVPDAH
ncbi:MAG: C10 family peptidase [Bacteroidales bacterium]|nr:C10 family peptidase [Bacteroidales bacterium]